MMKEDKIILSISMLISGRPEMKKSLDSLYYFTDALSCEIILVDTGCTPEYRALAEQYTDKIYDFTWCNDFAAARNVGLHAASGEWFLYLDDDEWFENPTDIIEFFRSGEYRDYKSASYTVRNYFDAQGIVYEDVAVSRMIKIEEYTVFKGKIHEYLYPYMMPTKHIDNFVHHYGYAYKNDDAKRKHADRNILLLLETVEKEPEVPRWAAQLAQEYFGIDRYADAVEVCEKGLVHWHRIKGNPYEIDQIGALYGFMLIALESLGKFEQEEQKLSEALAEPGMPEASLAFFHFAAIRLYHKEKKDRECADHLRKYLSIYEKLKDDTATIVRDTVLITASVFQDRLMYPALLMSMGALIREGEKKIAEKIFYIIDWTDKRMLGQNTEEKKLVDAICAVEYDPLWVKFLQTLVSRENGMKEMYIVFLETEIAYKQQDDKEKLSRLRRLVAELDYDHKYILYTKILWAEQDTRIPSQEERKIKAAQLYGELFEKYGSDILDIKAEVWEVSERLQLSLEPMLLNLSYGVWQREVSSWCRSASESELTQWDNRLSSWKNQADIRYNLFTIRYLEGQLRQCSETKPAMYQLEEELWQYADAVLDFYRPYYKEFVFEEMSVMLPEEAQLALRLKELKAARKSGTDQDVIRTLREMTDIYPPLNGMVAYYTNLYRQEVHNRNDEMQQLASTLKGKVRELIVAGKLEEAKMVIAQLEQFIPEDEELQVMKQSLE